MVSESTGGLQEPCIINPNVYNIVYVHEHTYFPEKTPGFHEFSKGSVSHLKKSFQVR